MNPRPRPTGRGRGWVLHFYTSSERITRVASCIEPYFSLQIHANPSWLTVYRHARAKMRRNSTSLDSCQHDDIKIVTVSVARRRWTAPSNPRRPCLKHFITFYALLKHVSSKGDYFAPKGHYFAHWCEKRSFALSVNGAQTRVLHACVKKTNFGVKDRQNLIFYQIWFSWA